MRVINFQMIEGSVSPRSWIAKLRKIAGKLLNRNMKLLISGQNRISHRRMQIERKQKNTLESHILLTILIQKINMLHAITLAQTNASSIRVTLQTLSDTLKRVHLYPLRVSPISRNYHPSLPSLREGSARIILLSSFASENFRVFLLSRGFLLNVISNALQKASPRK